uniref:Uncharacterized protein n=1 Tax=Romanomermis culicivorax TaxID=13658 RepID=A0A915IUP8_ROMCU
MMSLTTTYFSRKFTNLLISLITVQYFLATFSSIDHQTVLLTNDDIFSSAAKSWSHGAWGAEAAHPRTFLDALLRELAEKEQMTGRRGGFYRKGKKRLSRRAPRPADFDSV